MKLNTNISLENIITIITMMCAIAFAYGFIRSDVNLIKEQLETKVDTIQLRGDRELITYKLDMITVDILEIKEDENMKKFYNSGEEE